MCVYSMIGDYGTERFKPYIQPPYPGNASTTGWPPNTNIPQPDPIVVIPKEEYDALKRDVEMLKDLLKRAKEYDQKNGEPDCELDEKMRILRAVAKVFNIEIG